MFDNDVFHLRVPLDASSVKGNTPDRALRVIAYGSKGPTLEQTVTLDEAGRATAAFEFKQNPGSLKVAVGPANTSAEDLKHMQTIFTSVPAASWRDGRSVTVPIIPITRFYWDWWWRWCQNHSITGRVLCPDGSPVVGATVCAYDVDSWWWWTSKEQVGCATTAIDGSFEIDFTRCCGWFPWWWWETREWLLDPYLVARITDVLKGNPNIRSLPRATPAPSIAVFDHIITAAPTGARDVRLAGPAVKRRVRAVSASIDPSELEPLRERLLEVLPRQFPIPIWPWYPWAPWWDCSANVMFQVSQNCGGRINSVVNETYADIHWDIPENLNVTLVTNDQACCAYNCDEHNCPQGNCLVPSDICDINVGSIGGNVGATGTAAQAGLAYPGTQDRPFAGAVQFFGQFGDAANVDYYEFLYSATGKSGPYIPLPLAAIEAFSRQVFTGVTWVPVGFAPNTIDDTTATTHYVTETIQHYVANNGAQIWDSITHDLLLVLNSANVLTNGTYYLQLVGWQRPGYSGDLTNPAVLPVCNPDPHGPEDNYWVVTLDNQAPGNTDPTGQTCGIHICTDQPISDIIQVAIQHADASITTVSGCSLVCVTDTDQLLVDFAAYDPDGFLASYSLELLYGVDQSVDLLSVGTLSASPMAPVWAPAPPTGPNAPHQTLVGSDYASALAEGAASPVWNGGSMRLTVSATAAFPTLPCAYLMQLNVYKRPIVDCNDADVQYNVSFQSFTVQACS